MSVARLAANVKSGRGRQRTLTATGLHHTSDYTPYEGMAVNGAVRSVLLRGEDVVRDGHFVGRRGHGRFQERTLAGE